jgi:hypothetical protein
VLVEDLLRKPVQLLVHPLHPTSEALHVELPQPRHPLADVTHGAGHRERLIQGAPKRLAFLTAVEAQPLVPDRHAKDVPHGEVHEVLLHLDGGAGGLELAASQRARLLRAHALERVDAAWGEELGGTQLACHAPVGAVGSLRRMPLQP